jgi:hypothetical protein
VLDPPASAKRARLHHTIDDRPGTTRRKARGGFDYRQPDGSLVRDIETLRRIKSLVIPPARSRTADEPLFRHFSRCSPPFGRRGLNRPDHPLARP